MLCYSMLVTEIKVLVIAARSSRGQWQTIAEVINQRDENLLNTNN